MDPNSMISYYNKVGLYVKKLNFSWRAKRCCGFFYAPLSAYEGENNGFYGIIGLLMCR